ncbi:YDR124W [Zygosaccharomyces parabailii]|uniref:ZYBA0S07-03004g1_1 n=1 Tax=Zygosaccharomyces bailii (strain CLIB 213 / ATCC 58445 / CBS 680 / BCRC 21525 / NBRC 1098 / NCYC 1416 / NRRL Y-2227) TaxID=1333698 RepID=A0A8J2X9L1_ZYGB2|nr:YDR124W [Zygosaccharomyces parabailii]CDF90524.1 ZYBA0S07-03004g1_1 [Zygosaccharomyces bailii CLIB 213]CDH15110.1 uncharacterized protein ZBAI_06897 [Zygosaccharomyces bailii ISA1307]
MSKFNDIAALLLKEGYEFSIFVKDKDPSNKSNRKFSNAYVTTKAEEWLPSGVWDLVESDKVTKYESSLCVSKHTCKMIPLSLNNTSLVEKYVYCALKLLRQVPCKAIAKAWIKIIEPRKKTKYPYIKGNIAKPTWWPQDVEHREPDHLQKPDRLKLMCAILTQVLPKLGCIESVDELSRSTFALSLFKQDPRKNLIISSIFEIPRALCNAQKMKKTVVDVVDLSSFGRKFNANDCISFEKQTPNLECKPRFPLQLSHSTESVLPLVERSSTDYIMGTFENGSLSPPILIDLLIKNDPDLNDYISTMNMCPSPDSEN